MTLDGNTMRIEAGDVCVTRNVQSLSLGNAGLSPMRLLVVAAELGGRRTPALPTVPS